MPTLLAVDTSGVYCSLAIHASGRWFEDTQPVERLHNQVVLHRLDALIEQAGVAPGAFARVAFAAGPGSFTGIRIAAAVAQGVAFACGARVVAVSSSLALATAASTLDSAAGATLLTCTRSRRDANYLAAYRRGGGATLEQVLADGLHLGAQRPDDWNDAWVGVGDRPDWWPAGQPFVDGVVVTARLVGELAQVEFDAGRGGPPASALPRYVAGDSPWQPARS